MPNIDTPLDTFIASKGAATISPFPAAGPNQRGPTCGFYALAYVMLYWYLRQQEYGGDFLLTRPLEARTNNVHAPRERAGVFAGIGKSLSAVSGSFYSLRHYGKYNQLTAYGSVFNAENMVKIARGEGAKYAGQFDGAVITVASTQDFVDKVKALIDVGCPVIVPFDVDVATADPGRDTGNAAHWATIVGTYDEGGDMAIHYHWGRYHYCPLADFGDSNRQLTGNTFLTFRKCEATHPHSTVLVRDFMTAETIRSYQTHGWTVKARPGVVTNYEFCQPQSRDHLRSLEHLRTHFPSLAKALEDDRLKANGFDPMNLANAGLKDKIVAVFPAVARATVMGVL